MQFCFFIFREIKRSNLCYRLALYLRTILTHARNEKDSKYKGVYVFAFVFMFVFVFVVRYNSS